MPFSCVNHQAAAVTIYASKFKNYNIIDNKFRLCANDYDTFFCIELLYYHYVKTSFNCQV